MNTCVKINKRFFVYTGLLLLSSVLLLLLFNGDSPLYFMNLAPDNTVYKAVAKRMLKGDILYKDIYEHKGLYLYFYYIVKELIPAFAVEVVLDFVFIFLAYQSLHLFFNEWISFLCVLLVQVIDKGTGYLYHFGGQSETLGKFLIMYIIYMVLKNYRRFAEELIEPKICFKIGILTAVLFFIKYTMTVFVLAFALTVAICCVKRHQFRKLLHYIGMFLTGFLAGAIPALIYFGITGAFEEFARIYLYDVSFQYEPTDMNMWPIVIVILFSLFITLSLKRNIIVIDMLFVSCAAALVFTTVATRVYYFGVYPSFLVLLFVGGERIIQFVEAYFMEHRAYIRAIAGMVYISVLVAWPIAFHAKMDFMTLPGFQNVEEGCDGSLYDVVERINESDDKSFLSRTDNCIVYLQTGQLPDTKYFINYNMVLEQHFSAYARACYKEANNYVNDAFNTYIDEGSHKFVLQYACNYINMKLYKKVGTYCSNSNYGKKEIWILYERRDS